MQNIEVIFCTKRVGENLIKDKLMMYVVKIFKQYTKEQRPHTFFPGSVTLKERLETFLNDFKIRSRLLISIVYMLVVITIK